MCNKAALRNRAAVATVAALLAGCSSAGNESDNANAPVANVKLSAAQLGHIRQFTVEPVSYHRTIEVPGTVDFDNDQATSVLAPFDGPVTRILVSLGQHVAKGQPLALVQSADYASAIGAYRKALVTASNARRLADADKDLAAHNGIPQRESLQAQTDAASAEADREAAFQALVALNVDSGTIRVIRAGRAASVPGGIIRSPIAGTIVDKQITPGQLLQAGTTPAFTVANLSRVWVLAQVPGGDLGAIRPNDPAAVDAGDGLGVFHGNVDNISATVDPNTRNVIVRIVLVNAGGRLKKQMYVDASIESGQASSGLLVPVSAVLRDDQNLPFIYIALPDGSFARRHVTLGYRDNDRYEIVAGLQAGDRIVVDGAVFLQFMQNQ